MRTFRKWHNYLLNRLAVDKKEAIVYLDVSLEEYQEDGDKLFFLKGVRNVVESQDCITELAKHTHMSADTLLKIISSDKAPYVDTLGSILNALGCRMSVVPLESENRNLESASACQRISVAG